MKSQEYRGRAAELRRMAERPDTPADIREQYLRLARDWEALAREADKAPPKNGRW